MFNCLTCLSLVLHRGVEALVGVRGSRVWRETGQQAQRDPVGLSQSQASIDNTGFLIHHIASGVVKH